MIRLLLVAVAAIPAVALAQPAPTPAPPVAAAPAPSPAAVDDAAPKRKRKSLVAPVLAGITRVPGYPRVREYTAPEVEPDPPVEPSETKTVQITEANEALVLARPWYPSALLGAVVTGARSAIRGEIHAKTTRGCSTKSWYALEPFGYICSRSARPTTEPPTKEPVLSPLAGSHLPFRYTMVLVKEGEKIPMWASLADLNAGKDPERQLEHGDTVAIEHGTSVDGTSYFVSVEGKVFPSKGSSYLGKESEWQGEVITDKTVFPFGWTTGEKVSVWPDATAKGKPLETLPARTRVAIAEEAGEGKTRMVRIGEGRWLKAGDVNEARKSPRPAGITSAQQWIDVDLGEQVLVAYDGEQPVYVTLTSSGRAIPTPRGNYPVWAKVSAISMKSQPYEDKSYFVNKVPWVLFFQAHNAVHGAYWHDRFGVTKSHGCVNVSPLDARHLFDWLKPELPPGWTGYRFGNLLESPTVHVHNSHAKVDLVQERPIGPPDKELEAQKLEDAEGRRAAAQTAPTGMAP